MKGTGDGVVDMNGTCGCGDNVVWGCAAALKNGFVTDGEKVGCWACGANEDCWRSDVPNCDVERK